MSSIIHPIKSEVADRAGRPFSHCVVSGVRVPRSDMPPFDPFTTLRRSTRGAGAYRNANQWAAAAGSLNTGTMFAFSADGAAHTEITRGGEHNDGSKPDKIPSSDAAIAAFVDLAAVKWRRFGHQGRAPKAQAPRSFPPFFFFFPGGGLTDHLYR